MRYQPVPIVLVCAAAAGASGMIVTKAFAADYLSAAEAQKAMFPDATGFEPVPLTLSSDQLKQLAERAGGPAKPGAWRAWQAKQGEKALGYFVTDAVIGKFELINYAVALNMAGEISGVEILTYRESHGYEVRNKPWRAQFLGKSAKSPLRVGDDINNISGATLSCTHLTDGIRRIAVMAQLALTKS
ncbi:hypothetical protein R20233_03147 [Ralstonia sp. LMG 32965]|uniref:FMN-binding protein n=1 Tax=Ralstonia flatus TaxID=3058601 RepID=UPI0028F4F9C5|nr:FMN-binding protein [Ralstonia sp. LMG 32965]CAJ0886368.1 hypothetical protein R20233_03147 [Ralstonia sp. LMG 32965]